MWQMRSMIVLSLVGFAWVALACAPVVPPQDMVMYVRNGTATDRWFVVQPEPDPPLAQGFPPGIGVSCMILAAGARIVMIDRPPQVPGALVLRILYADADAPSRVISIDIAGDGTVTEMAGTPHWWTEPAPAC